MTEPKYPDVHVQLSGEDGNAFFIIGRVSKALRRAGVSNDEIAAYRDDAMSGNYDNVLCTTRRWVDWS